MQENNTRNNSLNIDYLIKLTNLLKNCITIVILTAVLTGLVAFFIFGFARKEKILSFFAAIENSANNLETTTKEIAVTSTKSRIIIDSVATAERIREFNNYLDLLNYNSQLITNDLRFAIAENLTTSRAVRAEILPVIQKVGDNLEESRRTIVEVREQIKQNGDELHKLLQQGNTLLIKSESELLATLQNINKTTYGLQVLTNDSNLTELIKNSNLTMSNIQVTTKELADLSTHLIEPIVRPRKTKGLNKYLLQPTLKVLRVLNGTGNLVYLVSRF